MEKLTIFRKAAKAYVIYIRPFLIKKLDAVLVFPGARLFARTLYYKIHSIFRKKFLFLKRYYRQYSLNVRLMAIKSGRKSIPPAIFMPSANPGVSIIIPVFNKAHFTYNCLLSLLRCKVSESFEVIVVNNASSDSTAEILELFKDGISVISNKENFGFVKACNLGAAAAKGRHLVFLNNDTEVSDGWLDSLTDIIRCFSDAGAVGAKLVYPNGILQEAGGIIWRDGSGANYGRNQEPDDPAFNYVREVDYCSGACLMVRKDLFERLGGFDLRYAPAYYEDTDLCFGIRSLGFKVYYQPKCEIVHFEGATAGRDLNSGFKQYQSKNLQKFKEKWCKALERQFPPSPENRYWACDRREGPVMLFIDHYVPQHDKDAGSRAVLQYLNLLCELGVKIKFLGDNFKYYEHYTALLEQMGIEVLYGRRYMSGWGKWVVERSGKIDYVFFSRPHVSAKYIDFISENTHAKRIYLGHDLHFLRYMESYKTSGDKQLLDLSREWEKIEFGLFDKVNVIMTFSNSEKKIINTRCPEKDVKVIPLFFYDDVSSTPFDFKKRKDLLFVGGFQHQPNVDGVLWFVNNVFPKILSKKPDIKFIIAGSNPPKEVLRLNSESVIIKGYVSDDELSRLYQNVKIALLPLRYGAGVKGKFIEAIYNGVPVVSTSFGIEGIAGVDRIIKGRDTEEDFAEEVLRIYDDCKELERLSLECRSFIRENFTKKKARDVIISVL